MLLYHTPALAGDDDTLCPFIISLLQYFILTTLEYLDTRFQEDNFPVPEVDGVE